MHETSTPPRTLDDINCMVIQMMREMEAEAGPVDGDYPTGLWWYVGHLDRGGIARKVNNSEIAWSRRLTDMFNARGRSAVAEQRYPGLTRDRCDCVVDLGFAKPWWIEMKGAWREVFDRGAPNQAFTKHLHATAHDVDKLSSLTTNEAVGITLILVGFDRSELPITTKDLDIVCRGISPCWRMKSAAWDVTGRLPFRTIVWVWSRWLETTRTGS